MTFRTWLEQEVLIHEPYYRISSDIMYGTGGIQPGTYWTPRWDAILFMIRSLFLHAMSSRFGSEKVKIYKISKAIMQPAPESHRWAFSYGHDAGEMVLVKLLEQPEIIYDGPIDSPEIEQLVNKSFNYKPPVDHSQHGMAAKLKDGSQVWISGNYDSKLIEIVKKSGWQFEVVAVIRSLEEWEKFQNKIAEADWDSDQATGLYYFFSDIGWI